MVVEVACGVIVNENKVLCVQRSEIMSLPLKWEFPGGKIEEGETPEVCLVREIKEELNIEINIKQSISPSYYLYEKFEINLIPFVCSISSGEIQLTEHKEYKWLEPKKLLDLDWAAADIAIVDEILELCFMDEKIFS